MVIIYVPEKGFYAKKLIILFANNRMALFPFSSLPYRQLRKVTQPGYVDMYMFTAVQAA